LNKISNITLKKLKVLSLDLHMHHSSIDKITYMESIKVRILERSYCPCL